jgi:hypothetical protein
MGRGSKEPEGRETTHLITEKMNGRTLQEVRKERVGYRLSYREGAEVLKRIAHILINVVNVYSMEVLSD